MILSLRAPATVIDGGGRSVVVQVPNATVSFPLLSPRLKRALRWLKRGAADEDVDRFVGIEHEAAAVWYYCLLTLEQQGALVREVRYRARPIARMLVMSPYFEAVAGTMDPAQRWQLSRFAYVRRDASRLVLESPLSCARVELLHPRILQIVGALGRPSRPAQLTAHAFSIRTVTDFLELLHRAGMLTRVDEPGRASEDTLPALCTWHDGDLMFHARSRGGRHGAVVETFRFVGQLAPLPAVKPPMSARTIALHVPKLRMNARREPSLTRVLEERRSLRSYGRQPITLRQIGEFLYRAARIKRIIEPDGARRLYQASARPYPGGGACYELEIYLVIGRCKGLQPGLYHYDPLHHRLEVLPSGAHYVPQLLKDTFVAAHTGPRQVLIVLAARFQRISWKYNSSTYAAILKNVGVLYQTMYLVATAMNLAPCALGGGNSELFNRAVGTQFYDETSVGEFMLGSAPARASR